MSLVRQASPNPSDRRALLAVAWLVPFLAYLLTASPHGYWLESGAWAAAASTLGIVHPTGAPLTALVARLLGLLPLGALAWRISLASAVAAATAAAALFAAIDTTVRCLGVRRDAVVYPLALGATWFVSGAAGFWMQAVRPEVYALQAALVLVAVERIIWLEASWPTRDLRSLYVAVFALGLALANHPLITLLATPALMPTLARAYRGHGWLPLLRSAVALGAGLATYLYLPARAAPDAIPNLGNASHLQPLRWLTSGRAFLEDGTSVGAGALPARAGEVAVLLADNLHILCVLAPFGLYALLRAPGARRIGAIWAWLLAPALLGPIALGFSADAPDAAGYLLPAFAATGALASALVGDVVGEGGGLGASRHRASVLALAWVVGALGLAQLYHGLDTSDLAEFHATDDLDQALVRRVPARAVLLAHDPQTWFRLWSLAAESGARPDLSVVPVPLLAHPGMISQLLREAPELQDLLRAQRLYGGLRQPELESLAVERPVLVEMDTSVPTKLYEVLAPRGLWYEVLPGGAVAADVQVRAQARRALYARLYRRLGVQRFEPATSNQLLWRHYTDALYYMGVGALDEARNAVERGMTLHPTARPLPQMKQALEQAPAGVPMDVRPFLRSR